MLNNCGLNPGTTPRDKSDRTGPARCLDTTLDCCRVKEVPRHSFCGLEQGNHTSNQQLGTADI